ncbi:hypothetical protein [Bryocella elongata]|uniref:hypothetical protein n=1 Tax=Bryocella elongata TaxID=863522 RepID=UPI000CDEA45E|nr:hypothetical protein [Bryocella elongata]
MPAEAASRSLVGETIEQVTPEDAELDTAAAEASALEGDDPLAGPSQKEFTDLLVRVAKIEERLDPKYRSLHHVLIGVAATAVVGWVAWVSFSIATIKQNVSDANSGKPLITALLDPKSPQQLQASLSTVIATVETAQVQGKRPDQKKVGELSAAMTHVVEQHPTLPQAWQAAAELVNYKFAADSQAIPQTDCNTATRQILPDISDLDERPLTKDSPPQPDGLLVDLKNCRLDLDDERFWTVGEGKSILIFQHDHPQYKDIVLRLSMVEIHYSGEKSLAPISRILFKNCRFVITSPTAIPSAPGRRIMTELLAATTNEGSVSAI